MRQNRTADPPSVKFHLCLCQHIEKITDYCNRSMLRLERDGVDENFLIQSN